MYKMWKDPIFAFDAINLNSIACYMYSASTLLTMASDAFLHILNLYSKRVPDQQQFA